MSNPRPLVPTAIWTEFGALHDDPATLMNEMGMNRDITYVPGFSDLRREADLARAEGRKPEPLPVNVRWARRTKANGTPTQERVIVMKGKHYRPVTKKDPEAGPVWLKGMPPAASFLADGTIASADMQLMVCDQQAAQRNAAYKLLRWNELNTASESEAIALASKQVKGSEAEVTREIGPALSN